MNRLAQLALLWAFVAGLILPVARGADNEQVDQPPPQLDPPQPYIYTDNGDGTCTITGYTNSDSVVTIPSSINGLPVTCIGSNAFVNRTSLTSVTMPNGVTNIGYRAFFCCTSLISVAIPDNVTSIGCFAFSYCTSLTNVTISVNATSIGFGAFGYCSSLTSVTIPTNATVIGESAFQSCSSLTSLTMPNGVTNIGDWAFAYCTSLPSVAIPDSVISIGEGAFDGCTSLTNIAVNSENQFYSSMDGVLFNKDQTTLVEYSEGKIGNYTIPSSVTSIGVDAFGDCTNLTSVTLPNSVTNIGDYAFYECYYLTSVTIPDSVRSIGHGGFYYCVSLTNIYFHGNAPSGGSDSSIFFAPHATIYYPPNTTNWSWSFGSVPTVLWNPQVQPDATFGVQTNCFGFTFMNAGSPSVVVAVCTDLTSGIWIPVATNTLTGGSSYFSDPGWTNYPNRYYRFQMP